MNLKFFDLTTTFLLFLLFPFAIEAQEREKIDGVAAVVGDFLILSSDILLGRIKGTSIPELVEIFAISSSSVLTIIFSKLSNFKSSFIVHSIIGLPLNLFIFFVLIKYNY